VNYAQNKIPKGKPVASRCSSESLTNGHRSGYKTKYRWKGLACISDRPNSGLGGADSGNYRRLRPAEDLRS
jgi:hypothetical protein